MKWVQENAAISFNLPNLPHLTVAQTVLYKEQIREREEHFETKRREDKRAMDGEDRARKEIERKKRNNLKKINQADLSLKNEKVEIIESDTWYGDDEGRLEEEGMGREKISPDEEANSSEEESKGKVIDVDDKKEKSASLVNEENDDEDEDKWEEEEEEEERRRSSAIENKNDANRKKIQQATQRQEEEKEGHDEDDAWRDEKAFSSGGRRLGSNSFKRTLDDSDEF